MAHRCFGTRVCVIFYTVSFNEHASSLYQAAATEQLFWDVGLRTPRCVKMLSMHAFVFFQCDWRVCSDGAAHKFAAIPASWPADAPLGRDMKGVRCVACATTRQWCAFCFSLFRSFVPIGIVSKARTTCCQVWRFRVGSLDAPCFSCAVVSRWTQIYHLTLSCRNQDPHMSVACCCLKDGWCELFFACSRGMTCWVLDMVSFSILRARCHNHNTSSVSQVVVVLWLLSDMPMRTCHYHLLLLFTNGFASKMCWVRGV